MLSSQGLKPKIKLLVPTLGGVRIRDSDRILNSSIEGLVIDV